MTRKLDYPNSFNCRGVAYWKGSDGKGRIYLAANNRRLYALDAATRKADRQASATMARR